MSRYRHARIHQTNCTVELADGGFCDTEQAPDMPFPICARHAIQVYRHMHAIVNEARSNHRSYTSAHDAMVRQVRDDRYATENTADHRVYYARVAGMIKIGMTQSVRKRLANYPPGSELLAVEAGGEALERQRLRQFRHLLVEGKEWFRHSPELMDHIAAVGRPDHLIN